MSLGCSAAAADHRHQCGSRELLHTSPDRAVFLAAAVSTILAVLFLDESLAWHHAYGAALIFGGILMTTFRTGKGKAL